MACIIYTPLLNDWKLKYYHCPHCNGAWKGDTHTSLGRCPLAFNTAHNRSLIVYYRPRPLVDRIVACTAAALRQVGIASTAQLQRLGKSQAGILAAAVAARCAPLLEAVEVWVPKDGLFSVETAVLRLLGYAPPQRAYAVFEGPLRPAGVYSLAFRPWFALQITLFMKFLLCNRPCGSGLIHGHQDVVAAASRPRHAAAAPPWRRPRSVAAAGRQRLLL